MTFINIQDFVVDDGIDVFGLAHTTITFLAFVIGAIIIFAFSSEKNIATISKLSAIITIIGFIIWLFFSDGYFGLVCELIFLAGIGGCVSSSSFSFVFILNNTERFFGSLLMFILISLVELSAGFIPIPAIVGKVSVSIIIVTLCICMYLSKSGDYEDYKITNKRITKKFNPSIWLVLFIFFSYFAIRISGFYAPAFQHPSGARIWGLLAFVLVLIGIILQVAFKRSIWTLCNMFFVASIMSYLMWHIKLPILAYILSELKEVGLLVTFYLVGCITNKFCNFRMHKCLVLLGITFVGIMYLGIDILNKNTLIPPIGIITAAALFIVFLLLSPAFSQYLFFTDWSMELRRINMYPLNYKTKKPEQKSLPCLDDTKLSPREKQVVTLLLQGMTIRQIAPELGLTASTVSTYSKAIYRKLGINSRAELFLLFVRSPTPEVSNLPINKP